MYKRGVKKMKTNGCHILQRMRGRCISRNVCFLIFWGMAEESWTFFLNWAFAKTNCACFHLQTFLCITLLIISGDIEVNPGPRDFLDSLPLKGNFHQGSDKFMPSSRGKQCVACSIAFLVEVQYKQWAWCPEDVDEILHIGDFIYRRIKSDGNVIMNTCIQMICLVYCKWIT